MPTHEEMNSNTAQLVLEAARELFSAEERRFGALLSKAQTLATIASIYFAALALFKFENKLAAAVSNIAILFGFASLAFSIRVIRNREFQRNRLPDTKSLATYTMSPAEMAARLAETYRDAVEKNKPVVNTVFSTYQFAVRFCFIALILGVLAVIIQTWSQINGA